MSHAAVTEEPNAMTDDARSRPAAPLVPQRGAFWAPSVKLWRAAFRPHPARLDRAIGWGLMLAGAAVAYLTFDRPAGIWIGALAVLAIVAALVAVTRVRLWPWQSVVIAESARRRREVEAIIGIVDWATATRWLAQAAGALPYDRYRILGFVGHDDLAEELIPALPMSTPVDRFWRAWAEVRRDWRSAGTVDASRAAALLPELDGGDRRDATLVLDWARGLRAAEIDEPLTKLRPPASPRLSVAGTLLGPVGPSLGRSMARGLVPAHEPAVPGAGVAAMRRCTAAPVVIDRVTRPSVARRHRTGPTGHRHRERGSPRMPSGARSRRTVSMRPGKSAAPTHPPGLPADGR